MPLIMIMYSLQDAEREAAVMEVRRDFEEQLKCKDAEREAAVMEARSDFEEQLKCKDALHDAAIREKDEAIRRLESEKVHCPCGCHHARQ